MTETVFTVYDFDHNVALGTYFDFDKAEWVILQEHNKLYETNVSSLEELQQDDSIYGIITSCIVE